MKYCPLCGAEYRRDVGICSTCGATLLDSREAAESRQNPRVLLWIGRDSTEFDLVGDLLRDSWIPAHIEEGLGGLVGRLLKSVSKIHVLQSDFDRALGVASDAIASRSPRLVETQTCHSCSTQCSAALAHCPKCKTALIIERRKDDEERRDAAVQPSARKICTLCEALYQPEYERCTVCGVELAPHEFRDRPLTDQQKNEPLEIAWRSGDQAAVCEAIRIVRSEGILHHLLWSHDHLAFGWAIPRPRYELRVFAGQAERVRQMFAVTHESVVFSAGPLSPGLLKPGEPLPESAKRIWNPLDATVEIWSDDDSASAEVLIDCLLENRIGVRLAGREPGRLTLLVTAFDQAAAQEIIREVLEGTPLA